MRRSTESKEYQRSVLREIMRAYPRQVPLDLGTLVTVLHAFRIIHGDYDIKTAGLSFMTIETSKFGDPMYMIHYTDGTRDDFSIKGRQSKNTDISMAIRSAALPDILEFSRTVPHICKVCGTEGEGDIHHENPTFSEIVRDVLREMDQDELYRSIDMYTPREYSLGFDNPSIVRKVRDIHKRKMNLVWLCKYCHKSKHEKSV